MKTREQIYGNEAADLLRSITMYKTLTEKQIIRLYPGKETVIKNLITHLTKQGRIYQDYKKRRISASAEYNAKVDAGLLDAVWVLIDFIDRVEYHYVSDFPVKIVFFADGEEYEIVYVPFEQETLISHVLAGKNETETRRIMLIDSPEQIDNINISNIAGFCTVNSDGAVRYYKTE